MHEDTIETLSQRLTELEQAFSSHYHGGASTGQSVQFTNLIGSLTVVNVAGDLTKRLASFPRNIGDQIFIDITTSTKKLYVFDSIGNAWRSTTIA